MKRIFYNIDNKKINIFECSHSEYFYNHKKLFKYGFDYYIRGIISNNILYLRVYNPFEDIYNPLPYEKLLIHSKELLSIYKEDILKKLKDNNIIINKTILNVSNIDLQKEFNTYYV